MFFVSRRGAQRLHHFIPSFAWHSAGSLDRMDLQVQWRTPQNIGGTTMPWEAAAGFGSGIGEEAACNQSSSTA